MPLPEAPRIIIARMATQPIVQKIPTSKLLFGTLRRVASHFLSKLDVPKTAAVQQPRAKACRAPLEVSARAMHMGPATAMHMPTRCCTPSRSPRILHAKAQTTRLLSGNIAVIGPALSGSLASASVNAKVAPAMRTPTAMTSTMFCTPPNWGGCPFRQRPAQPAAPHTPAMNHTRMIAERLASLLLLLPASSATAPKRKLFVA
mmetsp:Transcript_43802/g.103558  ORF Transcript_43802/g.103558 Transcript_43802/m.103558 type:complete len:203 (-) Transcript_43802:147-755(-)